METQGEVYTKYKEDLEQIAESGKALEESLILKTLQNLTGQKERIIDFFTQRFTKPNTFDWEKMNMTLLHLVLFYAKDEAKTII